MCGSVLTESHLLQLAATLNRRRAFETRIQPLRHDPNAMSAVESPSPASSSSCVTCALEGLHPGEAVFDERCVAHLDERELRAHLSRAGRLNAQGCTLDSSRLRLLLELGDGWKDADFSGAVFTQDADFSQVTFKGTAGFVGSTFLGRADFTRAEFAERPEYRGTEFFEDAVFAATTFVRGADFQFVRFAQAGRFTRASFRGVAEFSDASFEGDADFKGVQFFENADFVKTKALAIANFAGADFSGRANFAAMTFAKKAAFSGATFTGVAQFMRAVFDDVALFRDSTFAQSANFPASKFRSITVFIRAEFNGRAQFQDVTFSKEVQFFGATFGEFATFALTNFADASNFGAATFVKGANFTGASFGVMPQFDAFDCDGPFLFDPDAVLTAWFRRRGEPTKMAQPLASSINPTTGREEEFIADATAAGVRALRSVVESARNEQGANVLYEIEMRCRQRELREHKPSRYPERSILWFYRWAAGFGVRAHRPVLALLGLVLSVFLVLLLGGFRAQPVISTPPGIVSTQSQASCPKSDHPAGEATLTAIRGAIPGLDVNETCLTTLGRWTATFDRVLGAILLGLFALTVRSQVKRGA